MDAVTAWQEWVKRDGRFYIQRRLPIKLTTILNPGVILVEYGEQFFTYYRLEELEMIRNTINVKIAERRRLQETGRAKDPPRGMKIEGLETEHRKLNLRVGTRNSRAHALQSGPGCSAVRVPKVEGTASATRATSAS